MQLPVQVNLVVVKGILLKTFDCQVDQDHHSRSHSHRSSATDEGKVLTDLRELKPFSTTIDHKHDSFSDIMSDPLATLNLADFDIWLHKHKRNLLLDAPLVQEEDEAGIFTLEDNDIAKFQN